MNDKSLFTVPRYLPDVDLNKDEYINKKKKNVIEDELNKKNKEISVSKPKDVTEYNDIDEESDEIIYHEKLDADEQMWYANLIKNKKSDSKIISSDNELGEENEEEENVIICTDSILKNIYPFFKTEEDVTYGRQKKELKKIIKNAS
ncbi:hypothetical protein PFAG_01362 [Plasmodium falciparum Santa Lucia]|uniref:Uncharacterized protein n=14 Tax=Plasmodium falciparum TaxID=5833 RepID=C6KSZ1_PLAF7|nr:conserved Plasmodium protein, unknown function [Plasmodium falciparum 3D7]ETW19689.1 hypothetical protein PFFVO_01400 [Plasmodium falciparum Vietnam Oak-Knoll (FVO)]ETW31675.1 hypothetical protein PFFCH_00933 [Plasmodium falciparum FCH/4]ETW44258.1 hypothetical protein PFNF135_01508 [Plasmodium falciparum NF135/5.C10]ETW50505.1 hypothetical protein PFMALIP_01427 [Plasmodium falciparum MaliPS096_E11]ETW53196.1 hypothetical protein PFUGPA_04824 [Plasmodium falciparum Palo Alto/Uganda]ETW6268|eukprot:XP_966136.1 conserved Plasmodium protein, unknown function [Plasmodium falciparum 3D7]